MDPMTLGLLIGGGTGILKGMSDVEQSKHDRKVEGEIARYSPWTGMAPQRIRQPNVIDPAMQGALVGAAFGKQFPKGSAPAGDSSPTGPYRTAEEYEKYNEISPVEPLSLPEASPENGWLPWTQMPYGPQRP
jgi:hypothetical protein